MVVETPQGPLQVVNWHLGLGEHERRWQTRFLLEHPLLLEGLCHPTLIAGDFNVAGPAAALDGYSAPGPWIDHIEVRGPSPSPLRTWPDERRVREGMLLSDHAPVELDL